MSDTVLLGKDRLTHSWLFWLILITFIAIIIRSIPAWVNAAWGIDLGIYYGLTNSFIETKELINAYDGWGSSYQYFPVLYTITGIAHWITGIDVLTLLIRIAPIFGGLTITIFYFIVYEFLKDKKIALISAGILAVSVLHIYQTSHAAPLTIGHFFMMLSFYFFIRYQNRITFVIPLIISTLLLVLSHHFTTFFFIVTITFLTFAFVSKRRMINRRTFYPLSYAVFVSATAFSYWFFIAKPVFNSFMNGKFFLLPNYAIIPIYYCFLFIGIYIASKWHQIKVFEKININELHLDRNKKIVLGFIVSICLLIIAYFVGIPGVYERITLLAIIYSLPMVLIISFSIAGLSSLKSIRNGFLIKGWIFGLFLSLLYSIGSANLLPDRHFEYLIIPLCIPAALTLKSIIEEHPLKRLKKPNFLSIETYSGSNHHKRNILVFICVLLLFITNLISAYPAVDSLSYIDERVSNPFVNFLEWMNGNISNASVIASDHRLEMILWAEGFEITYGKANQTWEAENFSEYVDELLTLNITHIVIDDIMRNKVVNVNVGKYYYMTNESYEKFRYPPFEMIYRNSSLNDKNEEIHWVEIYKFDQDYLFDKDSKYFEI
jgi:hypothetical protein